MASTPRLAVVPHLLDGVRGVVFDKDGTLTDLDDRWFAFAQSFMRGTMEQLNISTDGLADVLAAIGVADGRIIPDGLFAVGNTRQISRIASAELVARGARAEEVDDALRHGVRTAVGGPLQPLGDVANSLSHLANTGMRIGVATADDRTNSEQELAELGIAELVTAHRCGSDRGPRKPSGEVLTGICQEWDLPVGQVIYVGDSLGDRATAHDAGMTFIAVRHERAPERWESDAWIASVDEIAALYKRETG